MRRRELALFAVTLMVVLAGCSYDTTVGVSPNVESVNELENGSYAVILTADADTNGDVISFQDVRVDGYTLDGDRVCTVEFGQITGGNETRPVVCQRFPSLLIPDTAQRGTVSHDDRTYDIVHGTLLYKGYANGSHRFQNWERVPDERYYSRHSGRPTPNESLLMASKCTQWQSDNNYSTLADAEWINWQQQPPETSRHYDSVVWNYTRLERLNQTSLVDVQHTHVYRFDELPRAVQKVVTSEPPIERSRSQSIDNDTFYRTITALSGRSVQSIEALPTVLEDVKGEAGHWNNSGIDCWTNPPQYRTGPGSNSGYYVKVFFTHDDVEYVLRVQTMQKYRGTVIANLTTSNATNPESVSTTSANY